jgi:hypothetical protein
MSDGTTKVASIIVVCVAGILITSHSGGELHAHARISADRGCRDIPDGVRTKHKRANNQ